MLSQFNNGFIHNGISLSDIDRPKTSMQIHYTLYTQVSKFLLTKMLPMDCLAAARGGGSTALTLLIGSELDLWTGLLTLSYETTSFS